MGQAANSKKKSREDPSAANQSQILANLSRSFKLLKKSDFDLILAERKAKE